MSSSYRRPSQREAPGPVVRQELPGLTSESTAMDRLPLFCAAGRASVNAMGSRSKGPRATLHKSAYITQLLDTT
jgi:hypothetical protein